VHQLLAAVRAQVRLRVPDVDDEQHDAGLWWCVVTYVLHAIPASHPCATVERALQLKGLPYRRVELIPVAHKVVQRVRFGETTVPALAFPDGRTMAGSRTILRALEDRSPALLPADPETRRLVERAEEWGDQVLQPLARRVAWAAIRRQPASTVRYSDGASLPVPAWFARVNAPLVSWLASRLNGAGDLAVRADLGSLPAHLHRVDGWIARGVLGGEAVNAADLQIGASLRLLLTVGDVAPLIDARPAGELARRVFPAFPGGVDAGVLPAGWVPAA
jgi:glutathione S-transferase